MILIDASVIVAILLEAPGYERLEAEMERSREAFCVSPLIRFEAVQKLIEAKRENGASAKTLADPARRAVDAFIEALDCREISISGDIGRLALEGAERFGLELADSFTYACARAYRLRLLSADERFGATDLG